LLAAHTSHPMTKARKALPSIVNSTMAATDQQVKTVLVVMITFHCVLFLLYLLDHHRIIYLAVINGATALTLLIYWLNKQMRTTQRSTEGREIIVLSAELLILLSAIAAITFGQLVGWLHIMQSIVFFIHFVILVLAAIFMWTWKMKKLW
jgi:peptidoglycan biosynthesis protein MviN/MurJ (putative lipid II flippase)